MNFPLRNFGAALLVAFLGAIAQSSAIAAPKKLECFRDWTVASAIVQREKLAGVKQLSTAAHQAIAASVVRTVLCKDGGQYVYRVVLRDRTGRLQTQTINARRPFGSMAVSR